jgi:hypothetical protein
MAMVTSGIPPSGQLFNTSVCRDNSNGPAAAGGPFVDPTRVNQKGLIQDEVKIASPLTIQAAKSRTSTDGMITRMFQALFFVNTGTYD